MVDLNVITEELTNNGFVEQPEVNADTMEFSKTLTSGDQEVFVLDFTSRVVTKLRYNSNDVLQNNATQKFTIKHSLDFNRVFQAIS